MLGIGKNKGGVALALRLRNTQLCFVNSHLAAHQDKVRRHYLHYLTISSVPPKLPP